MATQLDSGPPASARPTGTVTFLFSDIEGSTVRWERDRKAMAAALARHDALLRRAMQARGAYVFKTIGDAFCAAFATPLDAVAAALDAQRALAREDFSAVEGLRVRMALHAGSADERDGDYFGPTVNRVARLLAVGHGGQMLLSGACAELIQTELPPACGLRDLGEHRLKDLAQPERIHQLLAPDLIADFPPLRSLEHLSNNLPAQVSSFVGREAEIAEVTALIEQHRLVTLVGSGGVGKTRLSLHVAADLIDEVQRRCVVCRTRTAESRASTFPATVASALGITLPSEGDPVENLARALKGKEHAARLRQLRASRRARRARDLRNPARCAEGQGAGIEPSRAGSCRRSDLSRVLARSSDRRCALRRTRPGRERHVLAHRRERADYRRDLPAARRHSAWRSSWRRHA